MFKAFENLFKIKFKIIRYSKHTVATANNNNNNNNFIDLVKSKTFVDKSMLIKDFVKSGVAASLITCPVGFGKTTNMNMIKTFLEIDVNKQSHEAEIDKSSEKYRLFKNGIENLNLSISNDRKFVEKYLGQFPVIYIDFSQVNGETYDELFESVKLAIQNAFRSHEYLYISYLRKAIAELSDDIQLNLNEIELKKLENLISLNDIKLSNDALKFKMYHNIATQNLNEVDVSHSLNFLSELLHKHFERKVYILVDEYDTPIRNALKCSNIDVVKVNALIDNILCWAIRDNNNLKRGLISGVCGKVLPFAQSGFNNITERRFLQAHKFAKYYGFTREDVKDLFKKLEIDNDKQQNVSKWYNGYLVQGQEIQIHCPTSILKFIESGNIFKSFMNYEQDFHSNILKDVNINKKLTRLIQGETLSFDFNFNLTSDHLKKLQKILTCNEKVPEEQVDLFFYYLYELGYISYAKNNNISYFKIPNENIEYRFTNS